MSAPDAALPSGAELDAAITGALAGEDAAQQLADVLAASTLLLAVSEQTDADGQPTVLPVAGEFDGGVYGLAFTSQAHWEAFDDADAFILLDAAEIGRSWPEELGLAINPGSEPALLLSRAQLTDLLG